MNTLQASPLLSEAVALLSSLIRIPSVSRDEAAAADFLEKYLIEKGAAPQRHHNNIICVGTQCTPPRPTLLLNAHIDTVKPASSWSLDPYEPVREGDRLYGLGSNDCGGGLVTLLLTFLALKDRTDLPWQLVFLASAEEEVSGHNGLEAALPLLPAIDAAIVGEPTGLQPAICEKGLMVLDCTAHGKSGHAARAEGVNAIYEALNDIQWFRTFHFPHTSPLLGDVKMSVTMIEAGTQHNVVPDACRFVVDVRSNENYSNEALLSEIKRHVRSEVKARSTRLASSQISPQHPLIQTLVSWGYKPYGSPTLSDQALMPFPSFKLGPGESARSHTANEFITLPELAAALKLYPALICAKAE